MESKEKQSPETDLSYAERIKMYLIVFGLFFLIITLGLCFAIGALYYYFNTNGLFIFGISYAIGGVLFGGLCGITMILRSSMIFGICNLIPSVLMCVFVFFVWVLLSLK